MFMRPRDMARFGQLFLQKGKLEDGTQLVSQEWAEGSTKNLLTPGYGFWWWIGTFWTRSPPYTYYHGYYANGYAGQRIFIFPKLDMLLVMTSQVPAADPYGQASAAQGLVPFFIDAVVNDQ